MATQNREVIGWDIGGVHTKAARPLGRDVEQARVASRPFEIWRDKGRLPLVLRELASELGLEGVQAMAVTMTAELSDTFRSKREGVLFVLDALEQTFDAMSIYALSLFGEFVLLRRARRSPLEFAAANWLASALFVATHYPDCILMDVGSTTTDIIPIQDGRVYNEGRTDTERLTTGELVYTGVVRTNPNTVTGQAPVNGRACRFAAEHFTLMGDVYLVLDYLSSDAYTGPTPDGRSKSRREAGERLARLVCADGETLSEDQVAQLARYLQEKQLQQVSEALLQVLSRLTDGHHLPLVVIGTGRFLAAQVGKRLGMKVIDPAVEWGEQATNSLPCLAAAYLLTQHLRDIG